jgi:hypothetical protein
MAGVAVNWGAAIKKCIPNCFQVFIISASHGQVTKDPLYEIYSALLQLVSEV